MFARSACAGLHLKSGVAPTEAEHSHWRLPKQCTDTNSQSSSRTYTKRRLRRNGINTGPIYFDERFFIFAIKTTNMLATARLCERSISSTRGREVRNGWQEHSFTNLVLAGSACRTNSRARIPRILHLTWRKHEIAPVVIERPLKMAPSETVRMTTV